MKNIKSLNLNIILLFFLFISNVLSAQCWKSVVSGGEHTIGIKTDGTLWGWGSNAYGQLGNGTFVNSNIPIQISLENDWDLISVGQDFTIALKNDGTLWSWGRNLQGQLGHGNTTNISIPSQVGSDTNWTEIYTGFLQSFAKKSDGTLWSCGNNYNGQLGLGLGVNLVSVFTQIGTATDWNKIYIGSDHVLSIKNNGTIWAWGYNFFGQLGNSTTTSSNVPIQMSNDNDWVEISACGHSSFAIKQNGTLWSWGMNNVGQLGVGNFNDILIPTQLGNATNWSKIESGNFSNTIAKKVDGTFWSWGLNDYGQLGIGNIINKNIPTIIPNLTNCDYFNFKNNHVVAIKTDGTLLLWGKNTEGQIGDNSIINRYSPTIITCPTLSNEIININHEFFLFPNPTVGKLNIINSQNIIDKIELFDLNGRVIMSKNVNNYECYIDLLNLPSSSYLVKIYTTNDIYNKIVVKQ